MPALKIFHSLAGTWDWFSRSYKLIVRWPLLYRSLADFTLDLTSLPYTLYLGVALFILFFCRVKDWTQDPFAVGQVLYYGVAPSIWRLNSNACAIYEHFQRRADEVQSQWVVLTGAWSCSGHQFLRILGMVTPPSSVLTNSQALARHSMVTIS